MYICILYRYQYQYIHISLIIIEKALSFIYICVRVLYKLQEILYLFFVFKKHYISFHYYSASLSGQSSARCLVTTPEILPEDGVLRERCRATNRSDSSEDAKLFRQVFEGDIRKVFGDCSGSLSGNQDINK